MKRIRKSVDTGPLWASMRLVIGSGLGNNPCGGQGNPTCSPELRIVRCGGRFQAVSNMTVKALSDDVSNYLRFKPGNEDQKLMKESFVGRYYPVFAGIFILLLSQVPLAASTFAVSESAFLLDGKPFQIKAGEMHPGRIPHEYWADRLRMMHAMGLNTVSIYVFWNQHEPHEGEFNFSGDADIANFVRLAQKERLWVILRPGPYCCAEWEFGGFPWWLLKDRSLKVRS